MSAQCEKAVPTLSEFSDPRLVAIYDTLSPIAEYETFYLDLAAKLCASSIIDIGCGTGLLTCELAKRGHRLNGVEPSNAMLALARRRACGEQVEWIEGDALGRSRGRPRDHERPRSPDHPGRGGLVHVFGGWDGRPADAASRELIFVAARR